MKTDMEQNNEQNIEAKCKHLEFIQGVINRMGQNSFLLKGWTITLVSALFALAAKDSEINFVLISIIVIPVFWVLDGFFIATEKRYRELYKDVAAIKDDKEIDFNMDASTYTNITWIDGFKSKTLIPFYGVSIITIVIVVLLMKSNCNC